MMNVIRISHVFRPHADLYSRRLKTEGYNWNAEARADVSALVLMQTFG